MPTVRLLSYDVDSMHSDHAAIGRVIGSAEPDIVCVHRAPRRIRWRSLCGELARRSGLVVVAGGRDSGGELILSSLGIDVVSTAVVRLGPAHRLGARPLAVVVLRAAGVPFALAVTRSGRGVGSGPLALAQHLGAVDAAVAPRVPASTPVIRVAPESVTSADQRLTISRPRVIHHLGARRLGGTPPTLVEIELPPNAP